MCSQMKLQHCLPSACVITVGTVEGLVFPMYNFNVFLQTFGVGEDPTAHLTWLRGIPKIIKPQSTLDILDLISQSTSYIKDYISTPISSKY